jgi:hypothetical protein
MKSIIMGLLVSASAIGAANAQFKEGEKFDVYNRTDLECVPIWASERERDDPVYKITVSITLDETDHHLKELYVAHHTVGGAVYVRSDQYDNAHIWQTPNKHEWYWNGRRGRGSMKGEVWHAASDYRWYYSEEHFNGYGRRDYSMRSLCHYAGGDGGQS